MDIKTTKQHDGYWVAIDADDYDCDCDERGFFSSSPAGYGRTETEAIRELLTEIEERENAAERRISVRRDEARKTFNDMFKESIEALKKLSLNRGAR